MDGKELLCSTSVDAKRSLPTGLMKIARAALVRPFPCQTERNGGISLRQGDVFLPVSMPSAISSKASLAFVWRIAAG
jgi:hypothetical protein